MFKDCYVDGPITGEILKLDAPLSFWGGFDPVTGTIIDINHPQCGQSLKGKVLALPYAKGSAGTPGAIAEAIRSGVGPAAILVRDPDANLATGLTTAAFLYGTQVPGGQINLEVYEKLRTGDRLT